MTDIKLTPEQATDEREHCRLVTSQTYNQDPEWHMTGLQLLKVQELVERERQAVRAELQGELDRARAQLKHWERASEVIKQRDAAEQKARDLLEQKVRLTASYDALTAQLETVTTERDTDRARALEANNGLRAELATERAAREAAERRLAERTEQKRQLQQDLVDQQYLTQQSEHTRAELARERDALEKKLIRTQDKWVASVNEEARLQHKRLRTAAERAEHYICGNYAAIGYATGDSIRAEVRAALKDAPPAAAPTEPDTDGPNHHEHTSDLCDGVERAVKRWPIGTTGKAPVSAPPTSGAWYPAKTVEALLDCAERHYNHGHVLLAQRGAAVRASRTEAAPPAWQGFDPAQVRELVNEFLDGAGWSRCLRMAERLRASDPSAKGGES